MVPPRSPNDVESSLVQAAQWMAEDDGGRIKQRVADGIFKQFEGESTEPQETAEGEGKSHGLEIIHVDRYRIEACIGSGAMGKVYRAYDPQLDRPIAIKLLHADHSRTKTAFGRMIREARSLARLSHPNVIHVYDVGMMAEQMYIAMELIEGQSLRSWLHQIPRSRANILLTMLAAGRGLVHAHRAGLVHRDFKPDNIIVGEQERVCVVDFGLARPVTEAMDLPEASPGANDDNSPDSLSSMRLTHTGMLMGTPRYLAPEVFKGRSADALSDQYSFCVTLFEALYNRAPFSGKSVSQYAVNVLKGELVSVLLEDSSAKQVHDVICKGLQSEPTTRYGELQELLDALEEAAEGILGAKPQSASSESVSRLMANHQGDEATENQPDQFLGAMQGTRNGSLLGNLFRRAGGRYLSLRSLYWMVAAGMVLLTGLVWVFVQSDRGEPSSTGTDGSAAMQAASSPELPDKRFAPEAIVASPNALSPSGQGLHSGIPNNSETGVSVQTRAPQLAKEQHRLGISLELKGKEYSKPSPTKPSKRRTNDRRRSNRDAKAKHSPSAKDWCSLREDSYVLLIREKRRRARFVLKGQCYKCRVERRANRTRAFSPNDCRGYQLCWAADGSDCKG